MSCVFREMHDECLDDCSFCSTENRYFLTTDGDGHHYVVPLSRADDFDRWVQDEEDWEVPAYATRVEGRITFDDWRKK